MIRDEFIGTPMTMFESGAAIVEENPLNAEFVTINKLKDGSLTARDENVETCSSFLFEIDNEDLEIQYERAKKLFDNNIVNRIVFSGSKSYHCRITINDPPDNKEQYKHVWKKLNEKYFENKSDTACRNPARLTRMPNAIRKNGIKQKRLHLSNEVLDYDWRTEYELEKKIKKLLANKNKVYIPDTNEITPPEILLERNIPIATRKLLENSFVDGERHEQIPKAISFLKHCGYELYMIESLVWATGIKDTPNYVKKLYDYIK